MQNNRFLTKSHVELKDINYFNLSWFHLIPFTTAYFEFHSPILFEDKTLFHCQKSYKPQGLAWRKGHLFRVHAVEQTAPKGDLTFQEMMELGGK